MTKEIFEFYSTQSKITNPGKFEYLFKNLPSSIPELCAIVHGIIAHRDDTLKMYGFKLPEERKHEADTRYVKNILKKIIKLNSSPLTKKRSPEMRFLGTCHDFSILLCSILRHKKIPARLRCGFAKYFHLGFYSDHWVCEYWNKDKKKWFLVDPEIGEEEHKLYKITFDYTNLPSDQFLKVGKAWQMCRSGKANPNLFGVYNAGIYKNIKGWWFIRSSVLHDLTLLNKVELLPWDYTGFSDKQFKNISELPSKEVQLIDKIASLTTAGNKAFTEIRSLYENNSYFQASGYITSYTLSGPRKVKLS